MLHKFLHRHAILANKKKHVKRVIRFVVEIKTSGYISNLYRLIPGILINSIIVNVKSKSHKPIIDFTLFPAAQLFKISLAGFLKNLLSLSRPAQQLLNIFSFHYDLLLPLSLGAGNYNRYNPTAKPARKNAMPHITTVATVTTRRMIRHGRRVRWGM